MAKTIRPEVRKEMRELARELHERMPPGFGFCLFMFDFGDGGFINYISDASREDMVATLTEFLERVKQEESH